MSVVLRLDFVQHAVTFQILLACRGQQSELSRDAMGHAVAESCVSLRLLIYRAVFSGAFLTALALCSQARKIAWRFCQPNRVSVPSIYWKTRKMTSEWLSEHMGLLLRPDMVLNLLLDQYDTSLG